ncbi:hypothetical protein KP509_05G060700 [Ceratopteris richardii]|uniref:YTH domain-containing protein n=1 Tax=Ceratopteris richardii TaxID=49495 RepID=A0A8T2UM32_CERRI|nr:hypothetical protein KP509_05G060700 [Ceratopteris richardii]KAH7437203.1 hypothetical protein KP509_05G060700 [Ceratopteris richardii]KAH7437204.1 hypothetical protein KP509_05G060700 [Ceratopteris richardii]KAH7437205.1 hypothetical protein KP509_05G060700 [Ceratopteris richardii]KAH7437206.1 hypothetical protein KP509_05G060700 [Ceratopteris richardii]
MGTNAPTAADNVADLLQTLDVNTQIQPNSVAVAGSQETGLDPSAAGVADVSNMHSGYMSIEGGVYYAVPPHGYYHLGGFDYQASEWEDYPRTGGSEAADAQNARPYNSESGPLVYHPSGLAYNPQHVYAPYTAGASMRADGQLYGPHGYPYATHLYQQSLPSSSPFGPSSGPPNFDTSTVSTRESSSDRSANTVGSGTNGPSGTRAGHMGFPSGLYGRGVLPVSGPSSVSQDVRVGYEGTRIGTPWSDSSKVAENQQRHSLPSLSTSGPNVRPLAPLLPHLPAGQQHRPRLTGGGAAGRGFQSTRVYPMTSSGRFGLSSVWEPRGSGRPQTWYPFEREKSWGRGMGMLSNGNPSWDVFNEQNKGPRTTRGRYQRTSPSAMRYVRADGAANAILESSLDREQYNRTDFVTSYENAKYFIIKSYSEDDIHKSIKYSVWASTVNGNRKLDAAYREAQSHSGPCPLFLFFSVNASGQFCGVAEMVGPVDLNKNLEFWQQDKWTGRIPVKWHIVKDVPNSQFRHIILENNDNKPVTNSRDTQEVPPSKGSEMLTIFKSYSMKTSILDDFQFYEARQKVMQDNRARKQMHMQHQPVIHRANKEEQKPVQGVASSSTSQDLPPHVPTENSEHDKSSLKSLDVQESNVARDPQSEATTAASQDHELSQADKLNRSKSMEK